MSIHITGASGSGTSTLAQALAEALALRHLDADDCYWLPTSPPFKRKRDPHDRFTRLHQDLQAAPDVVLHGSIVGCGASISRESERIVQAQLDAYNARDLDAWLATYHEDAEQFMLHGGSLANRVAGREAAPQMPATCLASPA